MNNNLRKKVLASGAILSLFSPVAAGVLPLTSAIVASAKSNAPVVTYIPMGGYYKGDGTDLGTTYPIAYYDVERDDKSDRDSYYVLHMTGNYLGPDARPGYAFQGWTINGYANSPLIQVGMDYDYHLWQTNVQDTNKDGKKDANDLSLVPVFKDVSHLRINTTFGATIQGSIEDVGNGEKQVVFKTPRNNNMKYTLSREGRVIQDDIPDNTDVVVPLKGNEDENTFILSEVNADWESSDGGDQVTRIYATNITDNHKKVEMIHTTVDGHVVWKLNFPSNDLGDKYKTNHIFREYTLKRDGVEVARGLRGTEVTVPTGYGDYDANWTIEGEFDVKNLIISSHVYFNDELLPPLYATYHKENNTWSVKVPDVDLKDKYSTFKGYSIDKIDKSKGNESTQVAFGVQPGETISFPASDNYNDDFGITFELNMSLGSAIDVPETPYIASSKKQYAMTASSEFPSDNASIWSDDNKSFDTEIGDYNAYLYERTVNTWSDGHTTLDLSPRTVIYGNKGLNQPDANKNESYVASSVPPAKAIKDITTQYILSDILYNEISDSDPRWGDTEPSTHSTEKVQYLYFRTKTTYTDDTVVYSDYYYTTISPAAPEPEKGETGEKGDKGDTGEKGDKGDKGDTGEKGEKGDKGDKGDTGETGATGATGEKGDTGAQGEKGDTGEAGKDADEESVVSKVTNWFTNNVDLFKGDTGATGAQGIQGLTGAQGLKGDTGFMGQTGPQGASGVAGSNGQNGQNGLNGNDGKDGSTPTIGDNGHWFIDGKDTGVSARPDASLQSIPVAAAQYSVQNHYTSVDEDGNWSFN
jgi:hypothetical protein